MAEEARASLRLQAGARGQAARRGVHQLRRSTLTLALALALTLNPNRNPHLRRALDAPLHGAAAGVTVGDYERAHPDQSVLYERADFDEGQVRARATV